MIKREEILKELEFKAVRSSGKGGQNVNKVSTKVELRFNVSLSAELDENEKVRLHYKLPNRISQEGFLILTSETERTQLANKKKVIELFFKLLEKALKREKKRVKTKPTKVSKEKRLKDKKLQSEKKKLRNLD